MALTDQQIINAYGSGNISPMDFARKIERLAVNEIKVVITRDDDIEGFAAYCSPSLTEDKEGLVLLNVFASFMTAAIEQENPVDIIIENIMHEVGHALEEYFGQEFDEERIEGIVEKYRAIYEANKGKGDTSGG